MLRPSAFASSSRLTLEAFFDSRSDEAIWSSMSFARDEELVAALLAPPPADNTQSWIDPGAAYLGLRSSGLYDHYLTMLLPQIRTLYTNLRPTGMHQMLVSDLLLRKPDAHALREILQAEADLQHPQTPGDKLRTGLIVQAYSTIAALLRRRTVTRLSRSANVIIARALMKQDANDLLPNIFYEMVYTCTWEPRQAWPLLQIVARLARNGRASDALRLLQYPLSLGKLPEGILGRSSPTHPQAAALLVQSAIARTALFWGFDERANWMIDDLVTTMEKSEPFSAACELVFAACRAASVSGVSSQVEWARATLLRMTKDERFPAMDAGTLNVHLNALPIATALEFYSALPVPHAPLTPRNILRLAFARPTRSILIRLAEDLSKTKSDTAAVVPGVLRALASARLLPFVREAYTQWCTTSPYLDAYTTLTLVRAFTRGTRSSANTAFARTVLAHYLATTGRWVPVDNRATTALHAYGLIGNVEGTVPQEKQQLDDLVTALGADGARARLRSLAMQYPLLAHRLVEITRAHGIELGHFGVTIAAACAARHWGALSVVPSIKATLSRGDTAYIAVLQASRRNRYAKTLALFNTAVAGFPSEPILVPTTAAVLNRFARYKRWADGLDVVAEVLPVISEDIVEHVGVYLSAIAREAREARRAPQQDDAAGRLASVTLAWEGKLPVITELVGELETTPRTLLETMVEATDKAVRGVEQEQAGAEAPTDSEEVDLEDI
ncbi:uncharacterized protein EHS24_000471 [Apiotrichum porosum]|uniref:Uncharacterized protein n=1 Tax=Apiotrichum porosum TaxID=105984 RepID=A0A427Y9W4_9TREE|nr:uncharacterized protein EHS24_000471 [Apiotrichum porosum]RSH87949.1 hypothetical protein EHS24_000471 [Apiotrichum porosum]